jgi:tetratricopeptide (TPR) repeat protein
MNLVALHSKVYSLFNHLDEAERVILKATGIPDEDTETIITSVRRESVPKLRQVAERIDKSNISKINVAPHVALGLVYNILGDSINLRKEQQLMMDLSKSSDWVLTHSMVLYGIRASKEESNRIIDEILNEIKVDGENYKNQLQLTYYLSLLGRFDEAEEIINKYLDQNKNDVDFLRMKLNIEMAKGNTGAMKIIEKKILKIDPKAFDD